MEKEIKVDISSRDELLEKYNDSKISRDVVEYIIKEAMIIDKNEKIKIPPYNKTTNIVSRAEDIFLNIYLNCALVFRNHK